VYSLAPDIVILIHLALFLKCAREVRGNPSAFCRNFENTVKTECDYGLNRKVQLEIIRMKGKDEAFAVSAVISYT
jgi:hypothetical protein